MNCMGYFLVMSNVTGISRNLYNKCPKQLVEQNSSYSDYFNAISGFTSNSRAPGGPVTVISGEECTIISNASWVMVTWDPRGYTDTNENITFITPLAGGKYN